MTIYRIRNLLAHFRFSWLLLPNLLFVLLIMFSLAKAETIHHELQVTLEPEQSNITVVDQLQFPEGSAESINFILRSSLSIKAKGARLEIIGESEQGRLRHYQLKRLSQSRKVQLTYRGEILSSQVRDLFGMPKSVLSKQGVYLDGGSGWVPYFSHQTSITFNLTVKAPDGWEIISQGKRQKTNNRFHYEMPFPQDDIYLLGGRFKRYQKQRDNIGLEVYLLEDNKQLAESYLQTSAEYLHFYSELIAPYPYAKFAVVENRWQTGYGMPSFTLLGSRVIRLPFILHSSLPHEILHNWWGNGVYIDHKSGNWSEGLTAYLSDHLIQEQQGKGSTYRRKALERYANFAAKERDFALSEFYSRHNEASQAVGYSKSLMLFHMLRKLSGQQAFNQNIKNLWQRYQFKKVNFPDVIRQFFTGNVQQYELFVNQWLNKPGAPVLSLGETRVTKNPTGFQLQMEINQLQAAPYTMHLPVEIKFSGKKELQRRNITLTDQQTLVSLYFEQRPQSITIDPDYDVFRLLDSSEKPSSLGRLFGAKKQLLVLPTEVSQEQRKAWQQLAQTWSSRFNNIDIIDDYQLPILPKDTAVWLLGWENKALKTYQQHFRSSGQQVLDGAVQINAQKLTASTHTVVLLDPDNSRSALAFIGAEQPQTIALLARKLPHYNSFGLLAFELPEVKNIIKNSLTAKVSPLKRNLNH